MKAIRTKSLGSINTKGARIKASDGDGNTITISWDQSFDTEANHRLAARALKNKMHWKPGNFVTGWLCVGEYVHVSKFN